MASRIDLEALYADHRGGLLTFFARRTGDPQTALDLWAETFAQAVAGRRRFRGSTEAEAESWLYTIARRQLALYHRRGSAERRALDRLRIERPRADAALHSEIEARAELDVLRTLLADALADLSEPVRLAVQLRVVDELAYAEVARRLSISQPAARARVSRGLSTLAETLDRPDIKEATTR